MNATETIELHPDACLAPGWTWGDEVGTNGQYATSPEGETYLVVFRDDAPDTLQEALGGGDPWGGE